FGRDPFALGRLPLREAAHVGPRQVCPPLGKDIDTCNADASSAQQSTSNRRQKDLLDSDDGCTVASEKRVEPARVLQSEERRLRLPDDDGCVWRGTPHTRDDLDGALGLSGGGKRW